MQIFLDDLAAAGITQVTPTPNSIGYDNNIQYCSDSPYDYTCGAENGQYNWITGSREPSLNDGVKWAVVQDACTNQQVSLFFWPSLPYGIRAQNTKGDPPGPWKGFWNPSYNCSPQNPYFVGWQNWYNAVASLLSSVKNAGLTLHEFDIQNEINLPAATVQLRLLSDNKHLDTGNGNVFDAINYYINYYGLTTGNVTWSVPEDQASVDQFDCTSLYGDSARILSLDSLVAARFGQIIGWTDPAVQNGLPCQGGVQSDWVSQPRDYPVPTIIDFHMFNLLSGADASVSFDAYKNFLDSWGPAGNYRHGNYPQYYNAEVMMGETHSAQTDPYTGNSCEGNGNASQLPQYEIQGFNASALANGTRITVFRPWENFEAWIPQYLPPNYPGHGCYPVPATINPPYSTTP